MITKPPWHISPSTQDCSIPSGDIADFYLAPSLGYSSSPSSLDLTTTSALKVTRPRKQDRRQKKVTRHVFLCYVLGAAGSGKTSLLRSFVSKGFKGVDAEGRDSYEPTSKVVSVVNSVEMGGGEKYLVVGPASA